MVPAVRRGIPSLTILAILLACPSPPACHAAEGSIRACARVVEAESARRAAATARQWARQLSTATVLSPEATRAVAPPVALTTRAVEPAALLPWRRGAALDSRTQIEEVVRLGPGEARVQWSSLASDATILVQVEWISN